MTLSGASLRTRVVALVVVALLPSSAVLLHAAFQQRARARREAEEELGRVVTLAALDQEQLLDAGRQLVVAAASAVALLGAHRARCDALFRGLLDTSPRYTHLVAASPQGRVICQAHGRHAPRPLTFAADLERALHGPGVRVRAHPPASTAEPALTLSAAVRDARGRPRAAVVLGIRRAALQDLLSAARVPSGATLAVLDRSGAVLARRPDAERGAGGRTGQPSAAGPGAASGASLERPLVLSRPLGGPSGGLELRAGWPETAALARVRPALTVTIEALGLAGVFTLLLIWLGTEGFVIGPTRRLTEAAERLAGGDLTARSGASRSPGELGRLARAFDAMAGALQARTEAAERAQRELREMVERLQAVIAASPAAVIETDAAGRVTLWSPAAERLFGWSPRETLGRPLPVVLPEPAHASARPATIERRDGALLEVLSSGAPVRDADGAALGTIRVCVDVTAQRRLERRLVTLQRLEATGRLAAGVAHDFNNYLTLITARAEQLLLALGQDASARRRLEIILDAAGRCARLTRDLLAFGRPREGTTPQRVDLHELLRALEPVLRDLCDAIQLQMVLAPDSAVVPGDRSQLEQAIVNLVLNPRDAMPHGGQLTIRTARVELPAPRRCADAELDPGIYVTLLVSDTGVGMEAEVAARIFEPFFTTKPPGRGTGLGLAVVHAAITRSGGGVEVASRPGHGTTFTLYLPAADVAAETRENG